MTLGRMPLFVWTMLTVSAHDPDHPAAALGGPDHAAARPLPRRALLRHPGRRVGRDVAALLLVLRPPRGLRPDAAGLRLRLRDHPGLLAQGHLRLRDAGGGVGRRSALVALGTWAHHMFAVGMGERAERVLRRLHDAHRGAHRDQDLQLARHDVRRAGSASRRRCCSAARSCSSSCARGSPASCCRWRPSTGSSPTPTSWSRTSTSC